MANQRLQHYLRTYRRRSGFSQAEIALLLGASETRVSRHERFSQHPSVVAVFAYEIIFDRPARDLFAGAYESVRSDIRARAKQLIGNIENQTANPRTSRKVELLRAIVGPDSNPRPRLA